MGLIPGSDYAGGGVLPGYQNPVPTQERRRRTRQIPTPTPPSTPSYRDPQDVIRNYKAGNISYTEAYNALMNQFGFSDGDATDALTVELPLVPPIGPQLPPEPEPEPEPEPQAENTTTPSMGISDDQRFLLIGALVIGIGSRMIIKR